MMLRLAGLPPMPDCAILLCKPDFPSLTGQVYAAYDAAPVAARALAGELAADEAPYTDRWGTHISAYAPLFLNGRPVGAAVVDLHYESVRGEIRQVALLIIALARHHSAKAT